MLESIPGKIFIIGVVSLISFIGFSTQLLVFLPAYEWWTLDSLLYLGPLNFIIAMIFYNYYLSVNTDPGRIPMNWEPPSSIIISKEVALDGITGPRYCKTCNVYKPPRSHHCRYCKRCVLRMDHHCPWINNCVGHDNYGHFLRFIIYANIACTYVIILLIQRVRAIMDSIRHFQFEAEPDTTKIVIMVINFVLAFCVLFSVGILMVYQLYCLMNNQSNIEAWERSKVDRLTRRGKISKVTYPFDIGVYENICQVLGRNPLLWLWPKKMEGDGLTFPVIPGTDPKLPYFWPPRDPDDLRPSIFSSKYKRQLEAQRLLSQDPNAAIQDESDDYYDSGSCVSDSDAEYDEEAGMRRLMNHRLYDLSGMDYDTKRDEDSVPLASFVPRKSSKDD